MVRIRMLLKNRHNWIFLSLSKWQVLRYKIVTVLFDQAVVPSEDAKLLYIHAFALHSRTFQSSATPEFAPNIIAILPVVEKPLLWRTDASSDGHIKLTTKFSIIIDLVITRI